MVKRTMLAALAAAVVGLVVATPANAQDSPNWRFDLGINGGASGYTAMLSDDHLSDDTEDVRFKAGWIAGLQGTFWATPRIGIRANGTYSERPIVHGGFFGDEGNLVSDNNLWSFSGDLMFRLTPEPTLVMNREWLPFLALGIGGKNINVAGDFVLLPAIGDDTEGLWFTTDDGQRWAAVTETKLMGLAALGSDIRLGETFGLRLEVGDRIWDAPLRTHDEMAADPEEDVGNVVHELYAQLGAHFLMGLEAEEIVAVTPAPPLPPVVEPEPEPIEEAIRICVIDPAAPGGIRIIDATFFPERGDTMVTVAGVDRPISATLPNVMLASEADWFVRGEPLQIRVADDLTLEYTTWQGGRVIEADDLAFLGTVRGVPVYASSAEVQDVLEEIEEGRRVALTNDLDRILEENEDLREDIEDIQFLYVPLQPTGCVFQTVQVVEQVRKKDR